MSLAWAGRAWTRERGGTGLRIAVVQLGGRRGYAVPVGFAGQRVLESLHTDLHARDSLARLLLAATPRALRPGGLQRLAARRLAGLGRSQIRTYPLFGLLRRALHGGSPGREARFPRWLRANRRFGELVNRRGLGAANVVYCFNGAALETFKSARSDGLGTVLDQTSASAEVEASLLADERAQWAGWEAGDLESPGTSAMAGRERSEWDLADVIVCGSTYVRDSVEHAGGPAGRCVVVPYGTSAAPRRAGQRVRGDTNFRVLFAGTACLRKGIPYVWEAARALSDSGVDFRLVGSVALSADARQKLEDSAQVAGPLPRACMSEVYAAADVLLLPSISEGSAAVTYEAMAHGLPVITTPNAGSIVRDGVEGFVVPIRSSSAIVEAIQRLARDRELWMRMSARASERGREFSVENYGRRLTEALRDGFASYGAEAPRREAGGSSGDTPRAR